MSDRHVLFLKIRVLALIYLIHIRKAVLSNEVIIGGTETKLIGIAPFAQYDSKVYPLDLMQEVIDQIAEREDYKILLFEEEKRN
jgi:hypothetical protein